MKFDRENKVILKSLNKTEAEAFILFLLSEIIRHQRDIEEAEALIQKVKAMFKLKEVKMRALELKQQVLKRDFVHKFSVIVNINEDWYPLHDDEEVPIECTISLKSRGALLGWFPEEMNPIEKQIMKDAGLV